MKGRTLFDPARPLLDLERLQPAIRAAAAPLFRGRVENVSGVLVEAAGIPAAMGELCRIQRGRSSDIDAEVVGFRGSSTLLMPHGDVAGIAPMQEVVALGRPFTVQVGNELLGRLLDGLGRPLDGGPPLRSRERRQARDGRVAQGLDPLQGGVERGGQRRARLLRALEAAALEGLLERRTFPALAQFDLVAGEESHQAGCAFERQVGGCFLS